MLWEGWHQGRNKRVGKLMLTLPVGSGNAKWACVSSLWIIIVFPIAIQFFRNSMLWPCWPNKGAMFVIMVLPCNCGKCVRAVLSPLHMLRTHARSMIVAVMSKCTTISARRTLLWALPFLAVTAYMVHEISGQVSLEFEEMVLCMHNAGSLDVLSTASCSVC